MFSVIDSPFIVSISTVDCTQRMVCWTEEKFEVVSAVFVKEQLVSVTMEELRESAPLTDPLKSVLVI